MPLPDPLQRLAEPDTNTVCDALDCLQLPGAVVGIRPLWDRPTVVGRASTVKLAPYLRIAYALDEDSLLQACEAIR